MDAEKIEFNGQTYAIVIRKDVQVDKLKFFTSNEDTFQVGIHNRPKNSVIQPHIHKKILRQIDVTAEFLYIVKGKVLISIYDEAKQKISEVTLRSGDSILFTKGGQDFKFLDDTKIIEVKQGPYVGEDSDKEKF